MNYVVFAEMSDVVWQAIIGAVLTIVLAIIEARREKREKKTAAKVELVKTTLEENADKTHIQLTDLAQVTNATYKLSNHATAVMLLAIAELSEDKADKSNKPEDIRAAQRARISYNDHMERQAIVDADAASMGKNLQHIVDKDTTT